MTTDDTCDRGSDALAGITPMQPARARAERVRLRCRARLAEGPIDRAASRRRPLPGRRLVPVLLGAFSVFYAIALLDAAGRIAAWL